MTVRPPKGVRSAGNLAGGCGRSQKERIGVVPIQGRHQGIKSRDGLQRGREGGDGRAHRQEGASEAAWREREEVVGVWVPGAWVRK